MQARYTSRWGVKQWARWLVPGGCCTLKLSFTVSTWTRRDAPSALTSMSGHTPVKCIAASITMKSVAKRHAAPLIRRATTMEEVVNLVVYLSSP